MNNAEFAEKVQRALEARGVSSEITHNVNAIRLVIGGTTYEPAGDESPVRMAGRIYLDHVTGAEELRAVVAWIDYHREDFNDRFTAEELIRLWRHGQINDDRGIAEFADTWSDAEIATALAAGCRGDAMGERVACILNLGADDRLDLTWDEPTVDEVEMGLEHGRIADVVIGGRFRPTRATWQKLIDAGLPMCSWQEASESWDLEAAK